MPKSMPAVSFLVAGALLAGCQTSNTNALDLSRQFHMDPARSGSTESAFLTPAGNYALVTLRRRADFATDADASRDVLCTGPSPDWATALALAQQIQAGGSVASGPSASLSASYSATETISALAGRTAGVVALRDGLYKACEAYANGIIGKDAYSLILSQYGMLLVALAGGTQTSAPSASQTASGSSASSPAPASPTSSGIAVAVATYPPSSSGAPSTANAAQNANTSGITAVSQNMQAFVGLLEPLVVSCVNENDPTVHVLNPDRRNPLLAAICGKLIYNVVDSAKSMQSQWPEMIESAPAAHAVVASPAKAPVRKKSSVEKPAGVVARP